MLFKRLALRLSTVFFASLFSLTAAAQSFQLPNNQWELLSVPGDVTGTSIAALFGDELTVADYDTDTTEGTWRIWQYDINIGDYVDPGVNGTLNPGSAFWILQITGDTVVLNVSPNASTQATAVDGCAVSAGCFPIPLPADMADMREFSWAMVGSPFSWSTPFDDLRFKTATSTDPCFDGCTLLESSDMPLGYTDNKVWIYDNSLPAPAHRPISTGEIIPTWKGFWIVTFGNAVGTSPQLLVPDTSAAGSVMVRVTTPEGAPLEDVSVSQVGGGVSGLTDSDGLAELSVPTNIELVLQFQRDGYAFQIVPVATPINGGEIALPVTMMEHQFTTSFDASFGQFDLVGPDGSTITIFGNSFVDANGLLVSGIVDMSITSVDVSNSAELGAFPGEFSGTGNGQPTSTLVSQGTVEYTFSQNGVPIQLAENASAFIELPIHSTQYPGGASISIGDIIPMWSLNEDTGIWEQEGEGTVVASGKTATGLALQGEVSHFSWWNCDVSAQTGTVSIGVFGPGTGTAVIKGVTTADIGWRPGAVVTTSEVGVFTDPLFVPADEEVCYSAEVTFDDGSIASTPVVCATVSNNDDIEVILNVQDGPLELFARLDALSTNSAAVNANVFTAINRVSVLPATHEQTISYEVVGDVPPGLEVRDVNSVAMEIAGSPLVSGIFTFSIVGTNAEMEQSTVFFTYTISPDPLPPALDDNGFEININVFSPIFSVTHFYMQGYNGGGYATSWTLTNNNGPDLHPKISFNETTGRLTLNGWNSSRDFFDGTITATNSQGSDDARLVVGGFGDF